MPTNANPRFGLSAASSFCDPLQVQDYLQTEGKTVAKAQGLLLLIEYPLLQSEARPNTSSLVASIGKIAYRISELIIVVDVNSMAQKRYRQNTLNLNIITSYENTKNLGCFFGMEELASIMLLKY